MAYADFALDTVEAALGLTMVRGDLFPALVAVPVPEWLADALSRGRRHAALVSEKARSEILVVPILLAAEELVPGPTTVFSGQRLDVDPAKGLVGECDYIIARTEPLPRLKAPLLTVVEAKKADIDLGLAQCIAQMEGARTFNEKSGVERPMFGCVTSGTVWQFLKLAGHIVTIDNTPRFEGDVGGILAALRVILSPTKN